MVTGFGGRAGAMLALMMAVAAPAQVSRDQGVPETPLDIPANLQIFGKLDPNVRKPTAIVNDTVVTGTDVDQRLGLIALFNNVPIAQIKGDERDRLRLQILRQLIDETLQVQEAKTADIAITSAQVDQGVVRAAQSTFKVTPKELPAFLTKSGASERTLRREIEAELAWQSYLRHRVEPLVNVGDQEVADILKRLQAQKGTQEFNIKEIFLRAEGANEQEIFAKARTVLQDLQKSGKPFEQYAVQYSDSPTGKQGGDLGWVKASVLPAELAQAAQDMQVGQVAGPIENSGGYSILYLTDKRQLLTADPRSAKLSLKQLTVRFPAGTTQADATARTSAFATGLKQLQGCGSVEKVGAALGAEVVDNDAVLIRQLPGPLQDLMLNLQVGQATPPFGNPQEGVRSLVLCGRDDTQSTELPRADQIENQIQETRVNLRAQAKLRDLRRDAIIEYR